MNFKWWLEGLIVAAITGGVPSAAAAISDPQHADLRHLGMTFLIGAVLGISAWLRNPNPPPPYGNITVSSGTNFPAAK